jgi:glycosyltransferase involved in cell wall biosynthesis
MRDAARLTSPSLTILIPTYNRAHVLSETLTALTRVDREGLDCTYVIIANNCTDNTSDIVRSYAGRLPILLLSERRPGKNCALNRALRDAPLGDVVVFTDDDVTPATDWLQQIAASALRRPDVPVFGGAVDVLWPGDVSPAWAEAPWIKAFGFSWHHYANNEASYAPPACPFGPNMWVRRAVFDSEPQFDESIGPRPVDRIMGSETSFLRKLQRDGYEMLHVPAARVHHRIRPEQCSIPALRRRGYTFGRGQTRLHGWRRHKLFFRSRGVWCVAIAADVLFALWRLCVGLLSSDPRRNCELSVDAMIRLGEVRETLGSVGGLITRRLLSRERLSETRPVRAMDQSGSERPRR